jgi:hypothetical protein
MFPFLSAAVPLISRFYRPQPVKESEPGAKGLRLLWKGATKGHPSLSPGPGELLSAKAER